MGTEFHTLERKSLALIARDSVAYDSFVDSLMLLHDLVAPYSASRSHRRFDADYLEKRIRGLLEDSYLTKYDGVKENVQMNIGSAEEIVAEAGNIASVESAKAVETHADQFLDALLRIHNSARTSRRQADL